MAKWDYSFRGNTNDPPSAIASGNKSAKMLSLEIQGLLLAHEVVVVRAVGPIGVYRIMKSIALIPDKNVTISKPELGSDDKCTFMTFTVCTS